MFGFRQTNCMSCTWMMFKTKRTKPLCNEKNTGRYGLMWLSNVMINNVHRNWLHDYILYIVRCSWCSGVATFSVLFCGTIWQCPWFVGILEEEGGIMAITYIRLHLKCDGTHTETRFCLSAKEISPFKSAGASVQSTTSSRGVRICGSNAGYTMFRGSVKGTGYPLHSPVSPSLPLPYVTVCHHISTGLYKILPLAA